MGIFQTARFFPTSLADLSPVADDVARQFQLDGFEAEKRGGLGGAWEVSIRRGGLFKAVLGMKTALRIVIEPSTGGTTARAGVGIFGTQAVPTAISMLVFWPILVTQIWGLVRQSQLDDQAMRLIEASLRTHGGRSGSPAAPATSAADSLPRERHCSACGEAIPAVARFCPACGVKAA